MAIEIVDLPFKKMVIFNGYVNRRVHDIYIYIYIQYPLHHVPPLVILRGQPIGIWASPFAAQQLHDHLRMIKAAGHQQGRPSGEIRQVGIQAFTPRRRRSVIGEFHWFHYNTETENQAKS